MRRKQLVRVESDAETRDLSIDTRVPPQRTLKFLEQQHDRSLAHHRPRSVQVVRPTGSGPQFIAISPQTERVVLGHVPPGRGVIEATSQGHFGFPASDRPKCTPDGRCARLGGAGEVGVGALQTVDG